MENANFFLPAAGNPVLVSLTEIFLGEPSDFVEAKIPFVFYKKIRVLKEKFPLFTSGRPNDLKNIYITLSYTTVLYQIKNQTI